MADAISQPISSSAPSTGSSPQNKKTKVAAIKKPRIKPTHPPTSDMVNNAIKSLKERGGSSLQAIKKYLSSNYKIDAEKLAPFIKKYLKSAVSTGALIQTKGKGASGSFKLSPSSLKPKPITSGSVAQKQIKKKKVKKTTASEEKKPKTKTSVTKKKSIDKKKSSPSKSIKKGNEKKKSSGKLAKKANSAKPKKSIGASKPKASKPLKTGNSVAKKPKLQKPKKTIGEKKKPSNIKKASSANKKN